MRTLAAPVRRGVTCLICGDRLEPAVNAGVAHRAECPSPAWVRLAARVDHARTCHPDEWNEAQR